MALQWDDTLQIGIEDLDLQHKSIVEQFVKLSEAAEKGEAKELLGELALFMVQYATDHFDNEESQMAKYNYPKLEEQRNEHAQFKRESIELAKKLEEEGTSREMAIVLTGRLARWIIQHIRNRDREAGEFINTQMDLAAAE
jgi:hemerythrin